MDRRATTGLALAALLASTLGWLACGARSELELPLEGRSTQPRDAGSDAPIDAPEDAPEDAPPDVPIPNECDDPESVTYVYVVTGEHELYAFKPQSNSFELRGLLNCPAAPGFNPFSMAVSRTGIAYVQYTDFDVSELYRASVLDASCEPTTYKSGQHGFDQWGMGFAPNKDDDGESLYAVEITFDSQSKGLGRLDVETFEMDYIGPFSNAPGNVAELTPTGSGPLWGYFFNEPGPGGTLVEIDTDNADILQSIPVDIGINNSSLAVAWWGGAFYIFVDGANGGTDVHRYDPTSDTSAVVASLSGNVVGAGVSTCAPDALP